MATLIPSLGSARSDARGELRLAERLKDCLEDNAWVWHNIPVGPFGRRPDFVVLHPNQGIVVQEVKDWRLDTIVNANSKQVELLTDRGNVAADNHHQSTAMQCLDFCIQANTLSP
ncbi:MAG: nuclease-related domain-containing protein [Gallionella sp.]|nr:nuclease-related domain-containing protein [Gallionella sp.]